MPSEFNLRISGDATGLIGSIKHSMAALTGLEKKSSKLARTTSTAFKGLAILGTGGLGIQTIQRYGDILIDTRNRLSLVTDGTAELNYAMEDLFNISIATRSSFEATAIVYSRVALATREMGKSAQDLAQFTTTMNQAMILSGTKAVEAGQALIQLSQGMASGTLRGDELRSVLEQLPYVADLISTELGVTRGELRKLGREGKISTDIVFDAMLNNAEKVDEAFKKTTPSISQAANVFETSFLRAFSVLNESIPIVDTMAKSILVLAENVGLLGRALVLISLIGGSKKGFAGLSLVFDLLKKRIKAVFVGTMQIIKAQKELGKVIAESNKAIAKTNRSIAEGRVAGTAGQLALRRNNKTRAREKFGKRLGEIGTATGVKNISLIDKLVNKLNVGFAKLATKFPKLNKLMGVFMFGTVAGGLLVKTVLFLTTTFAGLAILITAAASAIFVLSGKITIFKDETTGATISVLDLFTQLIKNTLKVIPFVDTIVEKFKAFKELFSDPEVNRAFVEGFIDGVNEGVGNLQIAGEHIRHFFTSLGIVLLNMFDAVFQGIKLVINEFIDLANAGLKLVGKDPLKKLNVKSMDETLFERDRKEKERHEKEILRIKRDQNLEVGKVSLQQSIDALNADRAAQAAKKRREEADKLMNFYEDILDSLHAELQLLKMSSREAEVEAFIRKSMEKFEGKITDYYREQLSIAFRRNRAVKEQRALLESITGPEEERVRNNKYLLNLFEEGKVSLQGYLRKSAELNDTFYKMPEPINSVVSDLQKANKELQQSDFDNLVDSFLEAKKSSEDFIQSQKERVEQDILMGDILESQAQSQLQYYINSLKITKEEKEHLMTLYEKNQILTEEERIQQRLIQLEENRKQTIEDILNLEKDLLGDLNAFKAAQESLLQGGLTEDELVAYYEFERIIKSITNELFYLRNSQNGIKLGLEQVKEQTKLTADSVANELVNAFGHAEDAMVDFFMTGKIGFKEMINSMISDLIRFMTQKFIINSIAGGFSNLGSKNVQKIPGTTVTMEDLPAGMASGGITSGGLTMVGERGPELAALPKNTRIMSYMDTMNALGAASSSGSGAAPINVTVNQNIESSGQGQASDQDMLDKIAAQTQKAVKESIRSELKEQRRPRNMLNQGMTM